MKYFRPEITIGLWLMAAATAAALEMPRIFSDSMILQRDRPVPVWGSAQPGSAVTVSFAGARCEGRADARGRFCLELPPQKASADGRELVVSGDGATLRFQNVAVGDVWLCAGQSNVQFALRFAIDCTQILKNAADPSFRLFLVNRTWSRTPERRLEGNWQMSSPESAGRFSAVGWLFGNQLRKTLHVPIGVIDLSWGGCKIESLLAPESLRESGVSQGVRRQYEQQLQAMTEQKEDHQLRKDKQRLPAVLFNGMLHPLTPFGIRGVLWYQGEDNHNEGMEYAEKLQALAYTMRRYFRNRQLGIYLVQLPPWQYGTEDPLRIARFRQAQQYFAEHDPHAGFIVTTDCGDPADIHPRKKRTLAERLATLVLYHAYGVGDSSALAPTVKAVVREGHFVRVEFQNANHLQSRDGKSLTDWRIGNQDGKFFDAAATIDNDGVLLRCPEVPFPWLVRFGFHKLANPNLVNSAGVPAAPFEEKIRNR
ncbi:MAG: sialate O-acetylesterase [Victivallaceae bacterium]|nr:sialate O-acetylesterase [Victivallaceae bacterium]